MPRVCVCEREIERENVCMYTLQDDKAVSRSAHIIANMSICVCVCSGGRVHMCVYTAA